MAHIKTFDDFKKNMILVDKGVAEENGEKLRKAIDIAISWLQYAQRTDIEQDRINYTYSTYIPTVLRTILSRRHDVSYDDACNLLDILISVLPMLTTKIGNDEVTHKCIEQIFNPSQPLYMKLARFDKPPEVPFQGKANDSHNGSSMHDPSFLDSLEIGSCIDCLRSNNRWEIAIIEKFSDVRTECEIAFGDEERQWISLSDYGRFAPFGTKTGLTNPASASTANGSNLASATAADPVVLPPAEIPLTIVPSIGDLVDARNTHGIWYQGCVMDIREEEREVTLEIAPVLDVSECSVSNDQPTAMDVDGTQPTSDSSSTSLPSAVTTSDSPTFASGKIKVIFLRIAYVGMFESNDEWIDMTSNRLAVLNSTSKGRRGEYSLREEIFNRAWRGPSYSLEPNESTEVAYYMDYSFSSTGFVHLVRYFYSVGGIHAIFRSLQSVNNDQALLKVDLINALPLIRTLSHLSLVLSKSFYQQYQQEALRSVFIALKSISQNDIRSISVEDIEGALQVFEVFFYRIFNRHQEGHIIERFYLEYLWHFLRCPFLNRRLGGLKFLQDLLKRASMKSLYPDGIQRIEISKDKISYKVQKVTYSLTTIQICEYMMKQNILDALYFGHDTHDSLIERSGSILRHLSLSDVLETNHYLGLMRAGMEKNKMILKIIPEMAMTLKDEKMSELLDYIATVDHIQVNQELVNIVGASVERYRLKLMNTPHPSKVILPWKALHEQAIQILWTWIVDDAETSDAVAECALKKLESSMEIGISHQKALDDKAFRWDMQWVRTKVLMNLVFESLRTSKSIVPCVKLLGGFVYSWPMQYLHETLVDNVAPFEPRRQSVVSYLVDSINLFGILGNCIVTVRECFVSQFEQELSALKYPNENSFAITEKHSLISASAILKNTRATYQQHLDQLLDAVHMLYRSMEKKRFPVETVLLIWQELIIEANISEEFECGMNLIAKIPTKFSESTATSAVEGGLNSRESSIEAKKVSSSTLSGSFFHHNEEAYIQFFRRHLCDEDNVGIFARPFFLLKNFRCLEKWFRWINSEMGRLECSKESKVSAVLVDPAELVGVDAFLRVCFETHSEAVATASVTMITSLTKSAKYSKQFRENLVDRTMSMLKDVNSHISPGDATAAKNLKRPLLLLDGLIDESYLLSTRRLYPHSSLFHGNKAIFKISGTSKNTKSFTGEISLRLGETVEDLFIAVAKQMNLTPNDIKIFRQGKEILPSEFRKTISQLPMSPGERSPLVVAERPHKLATSSTTTASATGTEAEKPAYVSTPNEKDSEFSVVPNHAADVSTDVPVALSIATTMETFKCFFDLLSKSQGEQINHLWHTIGQLPTSWHTVAAWCHLDCQDVKELAFSLDNSSTSYGRVGELIYILQVIEIILYPVISLQEFVNQFGMPLESLAGESASSWCEKFVAKQGIQFLCQCYEWITNIMVAFNVSNARNKGQGLNGVNLPLLLLGSRVTNKLLKGFQARSLADDRNNTTAHKFLEDFLFRFHGKKVLNLFTANFSDDLNLTLRLQQIREKIVHADGGSGMNNKQNDRMEFSISPQQVISSQSIYWSLLLRFTAVMEMERRGKLLSTEENLSTKSLTELKKSFEGQEKRMLAASMQDLLFLWSAISISNPSLLNQSHSSTGDVSYQNLFRSVAESRHQPSEGSTQHNSNKKYELDMDNTLAVSVVDWFPTAFLEFVQWTMDLSEAQALVIESIRTLIGFRPPIVSEAFSQQPGGNELHDHYFVLLTKLLQVALEHHWQVDNLPTIAHSILNELREAVHVNNLQNGNDISNLKGNLSLFIKMCALNNLLLSSVSPEDALSTVNFLVNDVLGFASVSSEDASNLKLCLSMDANSLVYEVIQAFCEQIPSLAIHVYQSFKYIHRVLEPPKDWEVLPERQAKSRFGFVGLKNFGATCYMNSLLQVMFANASVRNYLLNELVLDDALYTEEELRNNLWYQLQKIFLHLQFSEKKWFAPSDWTFAFKDETGVQPLNTMMQQDAQEFLQVLFDRCETMMTQLERKLAEHDGSPENNEEKVSSKDRMDDEKSLSSAHDILNETYAGAFCNVMYVSPPVTAGGLASVDAIQRSIRDCGMRTQLENFVCISVDLVGPNLQSSLETFVKGETISDFTWKEDSPKCEIVKKQCLARLSDSVIFHLKRFKYNFDTFRREKINDKFEFPITLDMKPYTREGQPEFQPYHPHHHHHPHKSGENSPNLESTDTFTSPAGEIVDATGAVMTSPLSPSDILEIASRTPAYYEYELAGVVVHTGTADSGHYYAFLKHAETGKWHEFNDSEISQFDIAKLESECFGGSKKYSDYIHATQSIVETMEANPKNAYMLIYNRKIPLNTNKSMSTSSHFTSTSALLQTIHRTILADNKQHRLACRILAKDHLHFYSGILRILLCQVSSSLVNTHSSDNDTNEDPRKTPSLRAMWTETLQFLLKYALHTPHTTECLALVTQMSQWFAEDLKHLVCEEPMVAVAEAILVPDDQIVDKENIRPELPPIPAMASVTAVDTSIMPPLPPTSVQENASNRNNNVNVDSDYVILPPPPPSTADLMSLENISSAGVPPPSLHADTTAVDLSVTSPAPVLFTMTPVAASTSAGVSSHLLNHLCDEGDLLAEVFFAPNVQYRQAIEQLFFELFAHSWQLEKEAVSAWLRWQINGASADQCVLSSLGVFDRMMMAMSMPHPSAITNPDKINNNSSTNGFEMDDDLATEDPELLLALKLSQEASQPSVSTTSATGNSQQVTNTISSETEVNPLMTPTNALDFPHAVIRVLIEITQDHRLQMIPDDWRKSGQYLSFLASLLRLGGRDVAQILVRRDMIGQLLDIFLGDVSPLRGKVYFTAATGHKHLARKRAPSSYVTAHLTKDYPKILPAVLRSIPDWSELLNSVVMMVSECLLTNEARDFYQNRRRRTAVPISSPFHDLLMSEYDYECLTSKTLYTTLIKQARYRSYVCSLVKLLTPNNFTFSNMIMEVLWEEFSLATPESCLVLFEIAESLFSVSDLDFRRRAFTLLGRGQQSIIELAASMSKQSNKTQFLLTFIRSYLTLLQRIPELCSVVAQPIENVHLWAKWMLLHCHKMRQTMSSTGTGGSPAVTGGAFLVVYGETDTERELPWSTRAEKTYEMLALRLFEWGLEPDTWIVEALTTDPSSSAMMVDESLPPPLLLSNGQLVSDDHMSGTILTARPRNINDPGHSSLSYDNRHSLQNMSRNSLDSTNAIDGDDDDDRKYQELPTEEHFPPLSNNVGAESSSDNIGNDGNTHKKSVTIDTQVKEIGDEDVLMFMDGMTDEELERALAKGGLFQ